MVMNSNALQNAIVSLTRYYGENTIMRLSEVQSQAEKVIPTGISKLYEALGIGGIPKGRVIEIYGQEGAGKTALALQIARQIQRIQKYRRLTRPDWPSPAKRSSHIPLR